jgi:hypothetical protein
MSKNVLSMYILAVFTLSIDVKDPAQGLTVEESKGD